MKLNSNEHYGKNFKFLKEAIYQTLNGRNTDRMLRVKFHGPKVGVAKESKFNLSNITIIIVTNDNIGALSLYKNLVVYKFKFVIVAESLIGLEEVDRSPITKIVLSTSKNIAYRRNLACFFAETPWVLHIDSDEYFDDYLLESLRELDVNVDAYYLLTGALFSKTLIHQWVFQNARLFKTKICHYVGSAHEFVPLKHYSLKVMKGSLINNSYNDWDHYWKKFRIKTKKEHKSIKIFLRRLAAPLFLYLLNDGIKDGYLGFKILISSIFYSLILLITGRKEFCFLSISTIEDNLIQSDISADELLYLDHKISELKAWKSYTNSRYFEELEQISSPLMTDL